jgi:hypothetical protein
MDKKFSANVPSWKYKIEDLPGRRDENFYTGRFSSNVQYPVNGNPLKKDCDKKESRELKCAI